MLIGLRYGMTTGKRMPKFAEYLNATTKGPWIDTGVYANDTTVTQIKLQPYATTGDVIYGTFGANDSSDYRLFFIGSTTYFDCYSSRNTNSRVLAINQTIEIEIANNYVMNLQTGIKNINGTVQGAFTTTKTIKWLAGDSQSPIVGTIGARLYYLKIFDHGELVRDYRATTDKSGVACLYDIVNSTYTYNLGSGEFTAVYE